MKALRAVSPLAVFVITLMFAAASAAAPKDELKELRERIDALQQQLAESKEDKASAADALRTSERAISDTTRKLAELDRQRADAEKKARELQSEARKLKDLISQQQAALGDLLAGRYRSGKPPMLALLASGDDPNRIARQLRYYGYIARARADLVDELRGNLALHDELREHTEKNGAKVVAVLAEQRAQNESLEKERAARRQTLAMISRQLAEQRNELGNMQKDEERLTELIERIARIVPPLPPAAKREPRPADEPAEGAFRRFKGKLTVPVRGELAHRFGSPRSGGGLVWKGLFFQVESGRDVKAVAAGRVVFADWLRGFGNLMIVDHGENYMSLYGNNEALLRQVGDTVERGEQLASVGNSGGNANSGLYFEMRHRGKPFDPLGWLSLK